MPSSDLFDVLVLGGGPGGYVAALRASQLGLKTAIVEKDSLGGICLNKGCIPSKALLSAAKLWGKIEKAKDWGIEFAAPPVWNTRKLFEKKDDTVARLRKGLETLCDKKKVVRFRGEGQLTGPQSARVSGIEYSAKSIVLATGSVPRKIDFGISDRSKVFFSEEALTLKKVPASFVILGGGPEGCEFALIFKALGAGVTLIEFKDRVLPGFDHDASVAMKRALLSKGIEILTEESVERVEIQGTGIRATLKSARKIDAEALLVSAGRAAGTAGLGLEKAGVELDDRGYVKVDENLRTSVRNIYAVGDVTGRFMTAHAASYEGYTLASNLAGKSEPFDYSAVPACVYTDPEVAEVGLNEEKAKEKRVPYTVGRFSFVALGAAQAKGETEGFVKILGNSTTGEVIGGVIVGYNASDLINMLSIAVRRKLKVSDLRGHIAPHPSASEAAVEAAHLFFKEGLHFA